MPDTGFWGESVDQDASADGDGICLMGTQGAGGYVSVLWRAKGQSLCVG